MDIPGSYGNAHGGAASGIWLAGLLAPDVGEAVRIKDLPRVRLEFYHSTLEALQDFLLDWEDFADEFMGNASQPKWDC